MGDFRSKWVFETYPLFKRPSSYVLNRPPETARKRSRSVSDSHNGVVFLPVRPEPLLRLNIKAALSATPLQADRGVEAVRDNALHAHDGPIGQRQAATVNCKT